MRCTRAWEVGYRSALHAPRPVGARSLVPGDIVPRLVPDAGALSVYRVLPTGSDMNALTVCSWCWGAHAECPYSATEAAAVRKARKARKAAWAGREIAGRACQRFCPHGLTRGYRAKCVTLALLPRASSAPRVAAAGQSPVSRARHGGAAATR